ncbi:AraC family transcriptional regulator [Bosea sp. (in: a-proteobacteria)]|uniref:helix-turn-helix domain-containing protein n=1 Tax=Bosea sp. (in: a-proteobacteria) TaxID=1871050 RepID=UPI002732CB8F|nr:AraC family transcriptional regulator [Bosea sp. (in: a-proteobacteria)]MDP3410930.1 AraC family transcriptional regulator [Bosea sp. (in: a-proteobacteria)]
MIYRFLSNAFSAAIYVISAEWARLSFGPGSLILFSLSERAERYWLVAKHSIIDLTLKRRTKVVRSEIGTPAYTVEHVETTNPVDYEFSVRSDRHFLALHDLVFDDGLMRVEGEKPRRGRDLRETLTFLPAGIAVEGWCKPTDRPQAFSALYIEPDAVSEAVQGQSCWSRPEIYFQSPALLGVFTQLREVLKGAPPFKELLVDSLGQVAVATFASLQSANGPAVRPDRKLERLELQRIDAYLRENIAHDIRLDDMAGVLGMSKFHFIRCYRATTGRTPYRSLLDLRCQVAVDALTSGRAAGEAAVAAGFENAAQMSRSLRATLGILPRDIRG